MSIFTPPLTHTLMQTIARANRTWKDKKAGIIVDYIGIFKQLKIALAIYASQTKGKDKLPIEAKAELVEYLKKTIDETKDFLFGLGVDTNAILAAEGLERLELLKDAQDILLDNDDTKNEYLNKARLVKRIFKAILPDPAANEIAKDVFLISYLVQLLEDLEPPVDISGVMDKVEELLDRSVAAKAYIIKAGKPEQKLLDLREIDFKKLKEKFEKAKKRTEIEKLRSMIEMKIHAMIVYNRSRIDYMEKFQQLIDDYNAGSLNVEEMFDELVQLAQSLVEEEKLAISKGLSEEELAIFDILTRPKLKLTKKEEAQVKKVAQDLLTTLKKQKLVLDWRNRQQSRAMVRVAISRSYEDLPEAYVEMYDQKCESTYRLNVGNVFKTDIVHLHKKKNNIS